MKFIRSLLAIASALYASVTAIGDDVSQQHKNAFLTRAATIKQAIETRQQQYVTARDELFSVIDAAVAQIPPAPTDFAAERAALAGFRQIISSLREEGEQVQAAQSRFLEAAHSYHRELPAAAEVFEQISAQFAKYQSEEPYEDHRRDYEYSAAIFGQLAVRCRAGVTELEPEMARVTANVPYLERSLVFLTRLDQALETIPEFQAGAEYDRLLSQLKNYVSGYERMRASLRGFHDQLIPSQRPATPATEVARDNVVLLPAQPGRNPEMRWPLPTPANPWGQYVVKRGQERIGRVEVRRAQGLDSRRSDYLASYVGGRVTHGDVLVDPRR